MGTRGGEAQDTERESDTYRGIIYIQVYMFVFVYITKTHQILTSESPAAKTACVWILL